MPAAKPLNRRAFLGASLSTAGALLLAACGGSAAPASSAPASSAAPASGSAPSSAGASPSASAKPSASAASGSAAASPAGSTVPSASSAGLKGVEPLSPRAKFRLAATPIQIAWLPLFVAADKGYFDKAGIDLDLVIYQGSSNTQLPILAKGDLDMAPTPPSPALYTQATQGFDIKIVASNGVEKKGRVTSGWLTVIKDKADQIKELADLKGKTIEVGVAGTPTEQLVFEALKQAGLSKSDVNLQYRVRSLPDMVALAQQKGADVFGATEPLALQSEQQGLWVRWKSFVDIMPWFQPATLGMSAQFVAKSMNVAAKVLEVHLGTVREMNASNGTWSPDVIAIASKRAGVDPKAITDQGGTPYYDPNDAISMDSLDRTQALWLETGAIKQKVDLAQMVDNRPLDQALGKAGKQAA